MPTQRPFLSNFLAAFRSHTIPKPPPSLAPPSSGVGTSTTQTLWASSTAAAASRTLDANPSSTTKHLTTKPHPYTTSSTSTTISQERIPLHPSLQHNVSPATHLPRPSTTTTSTPPVYGPANKPSPTYPTAGESRRRTRRGSDSSSDSGGFREAKPPGGGGGGGGEQWFVGGRTASGEERFYKLSMIKRDRSSDRISADQLSL